MSFSRCEANTAGENDAKTDFTSDFHKNFKVIDLLGKGGFGIVFRVKNKKDANEYAVKRINMAVQSAEGIERELKIKDCDHENIIRYFDSWTEYPPHMWQEDDDKKWMEDIGLRNLIPMALPYYGNMPMSSDETPCPSESQPKYFYIQMELCDKDNLADWLLKHNMDYRKNKIPSIFEQIVAAVNYIHRKGLIHRDLKVNLDKSNASPYNAIIANLFICLARKHILWSRWSNKGCRFWCNYRTRTEKAPQQVPIGFTFGRSGHGMVQSTGDRHVQIRPQGGHILVRNNFVRIDYAVQHRCGAISRNRKTSNHTISQRI